MDQLPVFFQIKGRSVAVAGGGTVAARRAELALRAGANVRVFSEALTSDFRSIEGHARFEHVQRAPMAGDIEGCALVFCSTGDAASDRAIAGLARQAKVPINVADAPDLCDFIMPSIVDRDPLVIAISTGGVSPVFARMIRARLESVVPAAYGRLVTLVGQYRERLSESIGSTVLRRRFWERVLEGPVADRFLAGHEEEARQELERALAAAGSEAGEPVPMGEVYLVGAGPGDPDLLTFRALRLMQRADVVLYDRLLPHGILNLVRREAEHIYVGKLPDDHIVPQEEITARLVKLAKEGKRVLRLKGGDPFMFGRGGEEIEALAAGRHSGASGSGHNGRHGLRRLCRHSPHPSRSRPGMRVRDRPRQDRQTQPRLECAHSAATNCRNLYGAGPPGRADGGIHRSRRRCRRCPPRSSTMAPAQISGS